MGAGLLVAEGAVVETPLEGEPPGLEVGEGLLDSPPGPPLGGFSPPLVGFCPSLGGTCPGGHGMGQRAGLAGVIGFSPPPPGDPPLGVVPASGCFFAMLSWMSTSTAPSFISYVPPPVGRAPENRQTIASIICFC